MSSPNPIRPVPPSAPPEPVLPEVIRQLSDGVRALLKGGLNRKAVEVLLHDCTGVPKRQIKLVLDGVLYLKAAYCAKG